MVNLEDLRQLCDFLSRHLDPPDGESGPDAVYCDGTAKFTREYLESIGRLADEDEFQDVGLGRCDCMYLLNYPGTLGTLDEDKTAEFIN